MDKSSYELFGASTIYKLIATESIEQPLALPGLQKSVCVKLNFSLKVKTFKFGDLKDRSIGLVE